MKAVVNFSQNGPGNGGNKIACRISKLVSVSALIMVVATRMDVEDVAE
jgi:hypothetical protein